MLARVLCLALGLLAFAAPAADAVVKERGYLQARDGTKLRYSVERPDGPGPFPVLVNYEGYAAGSDARDNGVSTYANRLLARGYALVGVSVRGTGCSEGAFDPFHPNMGTDGADAVEWSAAQPWSNGRVGMIGVSFGGITQLLTAAERPPHLVAIAPSSPLGDLYRDVAYPGGIFEYDFPFAWTGIQKQGGTQYVVTGAVPDGDTDCVGNYVAHEVANRDYVIPKMLIERPFYDDTPLWRERGPERGLPNIEVPTLMLNAWQDEQLPARIFGSLDRFGNRDRLWVDVTNGNHGRDYDSASAQEKTLQFLDRFVRGVDNGFEERVPRMSIGMETAISRNGGWNEPAWRVERGSLDLAPEPTRLYLAEAGALTAAKPKARSGGAGYRYPMPSSDVLEPGPTASAGPAFRDKSTGQYAWKTPVPPGGAAPFTTGPLKSDLVVAGPASLDLWMKSTASDTDLQVTLTEVRPDGQETYVQRGWLRASHRKLDRRRSTALRPYQTHLRRDAAPLKPGRPTFMRVEVFPFAHAFRKGSKLRLWIEAPTGHTGFWAFTPIAQPATNTVLFDRRHPSRLVLGRLPGETARAPLPPCDSLRNQPCRSDPLG